jgi:hypothetical protein
MHDEETRPVTVTGFLHYPPVAVCVQAIPRPEFDLALLTVWRTHPPPFLRSPVQVGHVFVLALVCTVCVPVHLLAVDLKGGSSAEPALGLNDRGGIVLPPMLGLLSASH